MTYKDWLPLSILEDNRAELFKQKIVAYVEVSPDFVELEPELAVQYCAERLRIFMSRKIWSGDTKYVYYSYPESWWDMFKETYFPGWLQQKFPPKFKQEKIDVTPYFPDMKLVSDQNKCTLMFRQQFNGLEA